MNRTRLLPPILLASLFAAGPARAADLFVEPLAATGLPDDAHPTFQTAIEESFAKAGHALVKPGQAAFRVKPSVAKDRSRYDLIVKVVTVPGNKLVVEKSAECAPCTLDQAEKQVQLLVRTVGLDLDAAAESALPPADLTPAPTVSSPPSANHAPFVPQLQQARPAPTTAQPYELTGWYRAMMWTGIVPGVVGVLSAMRVVDHATDRERCGRPGYSECPHDNKLFLSGIGMFLVAEGFALTNGFDLVLAKPGRNASALGPWLGLATGASLAATGYLLIKNDGYGSDFYKKLGYADLPLAALATVTSLGTLIAGADRPVGGSTTAFIGPGVVGVGGRF